MKLDRQEKKQLKRAAERQAELNEWLKNPLNRHVAEAWAKKRLHVPGLNKSKNDCKCISVGPDGIFTWDNDHNIIPYPRPKPKT